MNDMIMCLRWVIIDPVYQWNSLGVASHSCSTCWLFSGRFYHSSAVCGLSTCSIVSFFHPAAQFFVCLGGVCAVLPSSSRPSPLQTSLGCSWFVLHYSLSSGCRRWVKELLPWVYWRKIRMDTPPPRLSWNADWIFSSYLQLPPSHSPPSPPQHTHTQMLHVHVHIISFEADTFTLGGLLA